MPPIVERGSVPHRRELISWSEVAQGGGGERVTAWREREVAAPRGIVRVGEHARDGLRGAREVAESAAAGRSCDWTSRHSNARHRANMSLRGRKRASRGAFQLSFHLWGQSPTARRPCQYRH